jgi:hypothetical protein
VWESLVVNSGHRPSSLFGEEFLSAPINSLPLWSHNRSFTLSGVSSAIRVPPLARTPVSLAGRRRCCLQAGDADGPPSSLPFPLPPLPAFLSTRPTGRARSGVTSHIPGCSSVAGSRRIRSRRVGSLLPRGGSVASGLGTFLFVTRPRAFASCQSSDLCLL